MVSQWVKSILCGRLKWCPEIPTSKPALAGFEGFLIGTRMPELYLKWIDLYPKHIIRNHKAMLTPRKRVVRDLAKKKTGNTQLKIAMLTLFNGNQSIKKERDIKKSSLIKIAISLGTVKGIRLNFHKLWIVCKGQWKIINKKSIYKRRMITLLMILKFNLNRTLDALWIYNLWLNCIVV